MAVCFSTQMHIYKIFCLLLLVLLPICDGSSRFSRSANEDDDGLILGYFRPHAIGIIVSLLVLLVAATVVACCIDFKGISDVGALECGDETDDPLPLSKKEKKEKSVMQSTQEHTQPLVDKSKLSLEKPSPAVSPVSLKELESDGVASQLARMPELSPQLDHQEKHARIIEAIYHASGRELPSQYSMGRRLYLEQTQEGSANRSAVGVLPKSKNLPVIQEKTEVEAVSPFTSLRSEGVLARSTTPSPMTDHLDGTQRMSSEVTAAEAKPSDTSISIKESVKSGTQEPVNTVVSETTIKTDHKENEEKTEEKKEEKKDTASATSSKSSAVVPVSPMPPPLSQPATPTSTSQQTTISNKTETLKTDLKSKSEKSEDKTAEETKDPKKKDKAPKEK